MTNQHGSILPLVHKAWRPFSLILVVTRESSLGRRACQIQASETLRRQETISPELRATGLSVASREESA